MTTIKARRDKLLRERGWMRKRGGTVGNVLKREGYTPAMNVAADLWGKNFETDLMEWPQVAIAKALGLNRSTICRWRKRLEELNDELR